MDKRFELLPPLFPAPYGEAVEELLNERGERVEELRLRVGCPLSWTSCGRELLLRPELLPPPEPACLEELVRRAAGGGVYAAEEQLRQGFLTLPGGHRLGVCGTAALREGQLVTLRELQSLNLRVANEKRGCADAVAGFLWAQPGSALILGPPGAGKTTVLRDLVRQLSDRHGERVGLVDERGELAACRGGRPQLDVGRRTDVLSGCPKGAGIELLLRSMAPAWIAVDEISTARDVELLCRASYCGVRFLATAHAGGPEDLSRRPVYRQLLETEVFETVAVIRPDRSIVCERMKHGTT